MNELEYTENSDINEPAQPEESAQNAPADIAAENDTEASYAQDSPPWDEDDAPEEQADEQADTDYRALAEEDLTELKREFYEARGLHSIAELDNPVRFAELRELGLSPKEAYLATQRGSSRADNRRHLRGSIPISAGGVGAAMTRRELNSAREIFSGMSDTEIQSLYKRVIK